MRTLRADDIFPFIRMISKLGIRDELVYISDNQDNENVTDIDVLMVILNKAAETNTEDEIYKFLARLFECKVDELKQKDMFEFLNETLEAISIDKWKSFFQSVVAILKKN